MRIVVMAGGMVNELWPSSRVWRPQQFLPLIGRRSMFKETLSRLDGVAKPEKIWVAADAAHRDLVMESLPPGARVFYEPVYRGSAVCLGLAAVHLRAGEQDEIAAALPVNNWIEPGNAFIEALHVAEWAADGGRIVLIGTRAVNPGSGRSYIKPGKPLAGPSGKAGLFQIADIVERPHSERARALREEGWLWNTGICVFRPSILLGEIDRLQPRLSAALAAVERVLGDDSYAEILEAAWRALPVISMGRDLLSCKPSSACVVRAHYSWSDLDDWDAIRRTALSDGAKNAVIGDAVLCQSRHCLVRAEGGRLVAVVGAEGMTVIETPDALLVMGPGYGRDVCFVEKYLAALGRNELL